MSDRLFAIFLFANFVVLTNSHDHDNKIMAIFATVISLMSKKYVCHFDNQTKLHMNLFLQSSLHVKMQSCFLKFLSKRCFILKDN
jgi:hypothetical protein